MMGQYFRKIKKYRFKGQREKNGQCFEKKGKKLKINFKRSKFYIEEEVGRFSMFINCFIFNNWDLKDIFLR